VPMNKAGSQTLNVGTAMTVGVDGVNIAADVTSSKGSLPNPLGFIGVTLKEIGISGGLVLVPAGCTLGLNGVFELGALPADCFAGVFEVGPGVPVVIIPVLIYGYFPALDFTQVVEATILSGRRESLPAGFPDVKIQKLYVCWADPANQNKLPDGSTPDPGFALSGTLIVLNEWTMAAALQVDYTKKLISGSASISPINLGNGALSISAPGSHGTGDPSFQVNTSSSPYFSTTIDVVVLKLAAELAAQVDDTGFNFNLDFKIKNKDQRLVCKLQNKTNFSASANLDFPLQTKVGPIQVRQGDYQYNLGAINVNETFTGAAQVAISGTGVSGQISGHFGRWTLPAIAINQSAADLSNLWQTILSRIESNAKAIFITDADTWVKDIKSGLITDRGSVTDVANVLMGYFGKDVVEAGILIYKNISQNIDYDFMWIHEVYPDDWDYAEAIEEILRG